MLAEGYPANQIIAQVPRHTHIHTYAHAHTNTFALTHMHTERERERETTRLSGKRPPSTCVCWGGEICVCLCGSEPIGAMARA